MVKWATYTSCDLMQVGNDFSRRPLSFAVQNNDSLKEIIDEEVLRLVNDRQLEVIKRNWWNENPERKVCEDKMQVINGISSSNIDGIFMVILLGMFTAFMINLVDRLLSRKKRFA